MNNLVNTIDGKILKKAILVAAKHLENKKDMVDDLNVFPVPDGDTGTNMSLTLSASAKDLLTRDETSISYIADCIARSSLRGARGNSGVILSQILRGFAKGLKGKDIATVQDVADALTSAADTAFKAVMKPTAGTILTVALDSAKAAQCAATATADFLKFMLFVIKSAEKSLDNTPNLLPVLKEAGVVDAGGMGFLVILESIKIAITGVDITIDNLTVENTKKEVRHDNIKYQYCTEFIILKHSSATSTLNFKASIEHRGDSMLVIDDDDIAKVHIHTNNPGFVLEQAVKIGQLTNIKIDNMKEQSEQNKNIPAQSSEPSKYGILAVCAGSGLSNIFSDLGVDQVVSGGQSMNPSIEDILNAIAKINALNIYVFPNNKNIILAANQAKDMCDKNIIVIPTKTIPEGISGIVAFDKNIEIDENTNNIIETVAEIKSGLVTFAARDSSVEGFNIKTGDSLALSGGDIQGVYSSPKAALLELVQKLTDDDSCTVTVFLGESTVNDDAAQLQQELSKLCDCDILIHKGNQPLYHYIIGVE